MNRRRLDFEATRDALLAVAGRLERTLGGPPVKDIAEPTATRRTLYGYIDRLNLPGLFRTFDFPNPDATSPERSPTTVPQQALFLMNNPLVIEAAKHVLARRGRRGRDRSGRRIAPPVSACSLAAQPTAEEIAAGPASSSAPERRRRRVERTGAGAAADQRVCVRRLNSSR